MDANFIKEQIDKATEAQIQIFPCHNLRASNVGHPCERYLYLLVNNWDQQKRHDKGLQNIFNLGNKMEEYVIETLKRSGFEILTPVERSWKIEDPLITGREDILIKDTDTGELLPGEIKGISPFEFDKLKTVYDFLNSKKYYIRAYPAQILTYMWHFNKTQGFFFIVNKLTGEVRPIELNFKKDKELETYCLSIMEKATRINKAIKEEKIPDVIDDASVCDNCGLSHVCGHTVAVPADIENDNELEELIDQKNALKEQKKNYEDLDEQIKDRVGEREKVLAGKYLIVRTKTVKPAHTEPAKEVPEKVTWRMSIKEIGDSK